MTDTLGGRHGIEVHGHYLAPAYKQALQEAEMWLIGGIPILEGAPQLAQEFMDAHDIAVQMLSVSDPGVEFVDPERAPALAGECNDHAAGPCRSSATARSRRPATFTPTGISTSSRRRWPKCWQTSPSESFQSSPPTRARDYWAFGGVYGDGGNRTHVRDSVVMASTSVSGALISSLARLAGGVAGDQSP